MELSEGTPVERVKRGDRVRIGLVTFTVQRVNCPGDGLLHLVVGETPSGCAAFAFQPGVLVEVTGHERVPR